MRGVEIFRQELEKCKALHTKVFLYGDPDPDGLFSLKLLIDLAEMLGLEYDYYVNPKRQHGFFLTDEKLDELRGRTIVSADFTIEPEDFPRIVDRGITILASDHHKYNHDFVEYRHGENVGIMINNQYSFEDKDNVYQSGAGVFYELACEAFPDFKNKVREAIVGITLLTDARALENERARKYLRTTYTASTQAHEYLNYLVNSVSEGDFGFGTKKLDKAYIDYTLGPTINALLRADKLNEAIDFVLGKGLTHKNIRVSQRNIITDLVSQAKMTTILNTNFIALDVTRIKDKYPNLDLSNYVGVVCAKMLNTTNGNSSICFLVDTDEKGNRYIGRCSFRPRYQDLAYLTEIKNLGVESAKGHEQAFGIIDFQKYATSEWLNKIACAYYELEADYADKRTILTVTNLNVWHLTNGMRVATDNCYTRDFMSTYIKYTGDLEKVIETDSPTYQVEPFTQSDYAEKRVPDKIIDGDYYKYIYRPDGRKALKFASYMIDGIPVKSLSGLYIDDADILIKPTLNKGYAEYHLSQIK